jgi:2,4-dienoyl-CoA reductase-like NADH-dependent reductase (Old Yellow Enzyme family)
MTRLFDPLTFRHGPPMSNRFMLAPLTNCQSHPDGTLSDHEFQWLTMRARGGFGLTMTCASHVQAVGQGFPGQLGIFSDRHVEGLTRLAQGIKAAGSLAAVQLHHAGMRSPSALIGATPVSPSADAETGARELSLAEIEQLAGDFVAAAVRAERAGFDGVEVHGAHGYILCAFLSPATNRRNDRYGGSLENRSRIFFDIVDGIRRRCRKDFSVGVRLSPERFGLQTREVTALAQQLMRDADIDYIDMSLWDAFKEPMDASLQGRSLLSHFTELERGEVRLGVAGKLMSGTDALRCLDLGVDFVTIGRAAVLHHDFPRRVQADPAFESPPLPVTAEHLRREGLGPAFVDYMRSWKGFVSEVSGT